MGWLQNVMTRILPQKWAAAMEAESRAWKMRCKCGHEISVWETGGIRWGARGRTWTLWRCPHCGVTWHRDKHQSQRRHRRGPDITEHAQHHARLQRGVVLMAHGNWCGTVVNEVRYAAG